MMKVYQKTKKNKPGQTIIEFSFCVLILFAMIYGLLHVFKWTGTDQTLRLRAHNDLFSIKGTQVQGSYSSPSNSPVLRQLEPNFYAPSEMNTIFEDAL